MAKGLEDSQVGGAVNGFGVLGGSVADFQQGPMVTTSNPLDMALNGNGFFGIETARGVRYTRDGAFTRSVDGELQTGRGEAVLDKSGKHIAMPSGPVEVSGDGTVSVDGGMVGQLGVFAVGGAVMEGTNRFQAVGDVTAGDAVVKQGAVEGANQDAVHGTMQLVLVQRQAEMMQKALTVFDQSFNKTAAEELGRV